MFQIYGVLNPKAKVLFSAGSNMGDRKQYLLDAINLLADAGISDIRCSSIYQTPPWGFDDPNPFLNMCFTGYTEFSPSLLMDVLIATEEKLGRVRTPEARYSSRTLDLDIILWDSLIVQSARLSIPHPRSHKRNFVLVPAAEIEPQWVHPIYNQTIQELLENCADDAPIEKWD